MDPTPILWFRVNPGGQGMFSGEGWPAVPIPMAVIWGDGTPDDGPYDFGTVAAYHNYAAPVPEVGAHGVDDPTWSGTLALPWGWSLEDGLPPTMVELGTVIPPTPGVPPTLDLDTVRAYVKVPATQLSDADLGRMLNGCSGDQWARCAWPEDTYPDALAQALLRRIQREIAARNLPLGMVGLDAAEYGPQSLPYLDALVEEHERAFRRVVLA